MKMSLKSMAFFFRDSANSVVMSKHVSVSVCVSVHANFCDFLNILLLLFKKLKVREDFGIRFKDFGREYKKNCRAKKESFFWSPPIIFDESRSQ